MWVQIPLLSLSQQRERAMPATTNTHFQEIGEGWEVNLEIQRETGPEATIDGVDYPAYDESTYAIRVLSSGDDLESLAEAFEVG
jgi:hypothetical protein